MFKKNQLSVGVEFDAVYLKLVLLKKRKTDYCILAAESLLLADGSSHREVMRAGVERLKAVAGIKKLSASIAIPDAQVLSKHIQLPDNMTENDILAHVHVSSESYFGLSGDEFIFDYANSQAGTEIYAFSKELLVEYLAMGDFAGIDLLALEPETCSKNRLLEYESVQKFNLYTELKNLSFDEFSFALGAALRGFGSNG